MAGSILKDSVHKRLMIKIIGGELAPGESLGEVKLAEELEVSRTPVREAIRQLHDEGFVEYRPHCGARIIVPTRQLIWEIFQVREALEGIATREAAARIPPERLESLRARFEALRGPVMAGRCDDVGDAIHDVALEASGNESLRRLMAIYRGKVAWLQRMAAEVPGRLPRAFREHESILCALEARDSDWAESVARAHVRTTRDDLVRSLELRGDHKEAAWQ